MIAREEFDELRRLIDRMRDHLDNITQYIEAHLSEGNVIAEGVIRNQFDAGLTSVLGIRQSRLLSENPTCTNCGSLTVRCGTCYRCYNCGDSLGCS